MPLGAFIKPSQEKIACDGKRAFHMCSMMGQTSDKSDTVSITVSSGTGNSAKNAGAGDDAALLNIFEILISNMQKGFVTSKNKYYISPTPEIFLPPKIPSF